MTIIPNLRRGDAAGAERPVSRRRAGGALLLALVAVAGCGRPGEPAAAPAPLRLDPPAGPGALAPSLAAADGGAYLSWLEPIADRGGHRLRAARLRGARWQALGEIASGRGFFANWADVPALVAAADGTLVASWLAKLGAGTYAYGAFLGVSRDGGARWQPGGLLHDDASETEHGFVSFLAGMNGGVQAVWLDGRETAGGGPMQLRTARLDDGVPAPSELLDDAVCDCCPTAMAAAAAGPVVAYRDRSAGEVRDIAVVRATGDGGWSAPATVHDDGWQIAGCPVNGPAIDAAGERLAVAWFTAAGGRGRVQVAFSDDGGARFSPPVLLDDAQPVGRVGVALDGAAAWVLWLASAGEGRGEIRLQRVSAAGAVAPASTVAVTSTARAAGVPRIVRDGTRLLLAWVDAGEPATLRVVAVETVGATHSISG